MRQKIKRNLKKRNIPSKEQKLIRPYAKGILFLENVVVQLPSHVQLFVTPWTQHARPPCPSPSPGVCPSSCPLHQWCCPAISSSVALFSFCPQSFPASGTFPMSQLFALSDQNTGASASVLPTSIQGWFPFRLLWSPCCPGDFQESSPVLQFEDINSLAFCLLYSPALTTVRDHWEDHNLDCMGLCWQSNVSTFQYTARFFISSLPRSNHLLISWLILENILCHTWRSLELLF